MLFFLTQQFGLQKLKPIQNENTSSLGSSLLKAQTMLTAKDIVEINKVESVCT